MRPGDGEASRPICSRDGSSEAKGYCCGGAGAGNEDGSLYSAWSMVSARTDAQESCRNADCSCAGILEHGDAIGQDEALQSVIDAEIDNLTNSRGSAKSLL